MVSYSDRRNVEVTSILKTMLAEEFGEDYSDAVIQSMIMLPCNCSK